MYNRINIWQMSLGKLIVNNKTYLINTDVSHKVQEETINSILNSYPDAEWEWFDEVEFKDVI